MCDEMTVRDNETFLAKRGLTRRDFHKIGAGAALAMTLPPVANAADVIEQDVTVETPDGSADCYFVHPAEGKHPAVIIWPDIMGIRSSFRMMGKRLAESGYAVLVVNLYYRDAEGAVAPDGASFSDPEIREKVMPLAMTLSSETCVSDGRAFVQYLDSQDSVDSGRKIGTMGYGMTGSYVLRLAADMPGRIGAGGSFHGGGLVADSDDSPHLLIPKMDKEAGFLIAVAENDDEKNPVVTKMLRKAFEKAEIAAEIEVYEGTLHGWCPLDSMVYNEAQAERAWARLLVLFEKHLA
jgi:carboxymethylenebutenolidase